jgi:hypothetical protein
MIKYELLLSTDSLFILPEKTFQVSYRDDYTKGLKITCIVCRATEAYYPSSGQSS